MNIIVLIEGREAVPVRAIPLLTNWESMPPAVLAQVLAGNDAFLGFEGLQAYQREDGVVTAITAAWWKSFCVKKMKALSERIELTHEHKDIKMNQWQLESLGLLPAGFFVWKDEYATLHESNWAARQRESVHSAWFNEKCEERSKEIDEAEDPSPMQRVAMHRVRTDYETWRTLDFSPAIAPGTYGTIVLEGFEQHLASIQRQAVTTVPAPVAEVPAVPGTATIWTDARKADARAYREKHGLKRTAEHYQVSQATISKHIPAGKPQKNPLGPWGGLVNK